ncbi:MAG: hypothetical protein ACT4OI_10150 [Methanobacteriota archaeon]
MASNACPVCGTPLVFVQQYNAWYCQKCQQYRQPGATAPGLAAPAATAAMGDLWRQNYYRLRKKALAIVNQYWIEDQGGRMLGYSKQKFLRLKEDIRIYTDENMTTELFRIQQQQIIDVWGNFGVIDSRRARSSATCDGRPSRPPSSGTRGRSGTLLSS